MDGKLHCCIVVELVNRKPVKRKEKQTAKHSTSSAGCKVLNNDLGGSIWENSIGSIGKTKAEAQDFLLYGDPWLCSKSPGLCTGLQPCKGTWGGHGGC